MLACHVEDLPRRDGARICPGNESAQRDLSTISDNGIRHEASDAVIMSFGHRYGRGTIVAPAAHFPRSLWSCMHRVAVAFAFVVVALSSQVTFAQTDESRFQVGVHVAGIASSEFDSTDLGVGGRLSWHPAGLIGADAELTFFPSDFDEPSFSRRRVEGLFGVTLGPRLGRLRPFVKVRPGFVRFAEAPESFACILIFPPPLACRLAQGATVFALDLGGGVEFVTTERTFVRFDIGDRAVRFPATTLDSQGQAQDSPFFSHDLRFQIGGGLRF